MNARQFLLALTATAHASFLALLGIPEAFNNIVFVSKTIYNAAQRSFVVRGLP